MAPLTLGAIRLCLDAAAGSRAAQAYLTTRVSQFFTVDTYKVEGKDPLVVRFLGERITYVGRTETERKPYQYRLTLRYVERTQQNPYGLVVSSVEQTEISAASFVNPQSKN
jgi:hypothetical protein